MSSYPSRDEFAAAIGSLFRATAADAGSTELALTHVTGVPTSERPFSVLFQSEAHHALPQQIYALEHAHLGTFDLFLVPLGPDRNNARMRYEAVFN